MIEARLKRQALLIGSKANKADVPEGRVGKVLPLSIVAITAMLSASPALALSKAARYLINEQISAACPSGGKFAAGGVDERDLTGDGKADLILDHGGITCNDGSRSSFCGIRACSVYFYVRDGNLLKEKLDILSIGATVKGGNPPSIELIGHGFEKSTVRWDGKSFR
jgi:hypothetical protein